MNRKAIISHAVALILGLIGGFLGKDLSGLQAPVEAVANQAVDAAQKATTPADAGTPAPAPAPAPADAGEAPAK